MTNSEWENARAADAAVTAAFRAWQAERDPELREHRQADYEAAKAEADRRWAIYGPDPMLEAVKAESARQAAQDSDPNPDDPDDE
jgi:ferredoxin-NADP reductase